MQTLDTYFNMEWVQDSDTWTCDKFKIICQFKYFKLYYDKFVVGQYNTLQIAKDEAKNYKI